MVATRTQNIAGAMIALSALAMPVAPALAQASDDRAAMPLSHMVAPSQPRRSEFRLETGDARGGIAFTGARLREGNRRGCDLVVCASWHRDYSASTQGWVELRPGMALVASYSIMRERRGNAAGALLTMPTSGISQSASLGLRGTGGSLSLTAFDRAGWASSDLADFARRTTNGEQRARRGVALEYETTRFFGDRHTRVGLTLERAQNPGGRGENAAFIRLLGRF